MTQPIPTPITGREEPIDPTVPQGALAEFYKAFNGGDLALMKRNWLNTDDAAMDNPLGGIRRGWRDMSDVYNRIFTGKGDFDVEFYDYTIHDIGETFLAVGRERGTAQIGESRLDLKIRTSRWFRMVVGRWRQLHHHGSIEDADLLARYQAAVR